MFLREGRSTSLLCLYYYPTNHSGCLKKCSCVPFIRRSNYMLRPQKGLTDYMHLRLTTSLLSDSNFLPRAVNEPRACNDYRRSAWLIELSMTDKPSLFMCRDVGPGIPHLQPRGSRHQQYVGVVPPDPQGGRPRRSGKQQASGLDRAQASPERAPLLVQPPKRDPRAGSESQRVPRGRGEESSR